MVVITYHENHENISRTSLSMTPKYTKTTALTRRLNVVKMIDHKNTGTIWNNLIATSFLNDSLYLRTINLKQRSTPDVHNSWLKSETKENKALT